jgi:Holliday junction resolvasome RuvABC endonuclease subunit
VSENLAAMSQLVDRLGKNKIYGHEKKGINCVRNVVLGNGRAQVKEQIQTLVGQVMRLAFVDKTLQKQIEIFNNSNGTMDCKITG